MYSLKFLTQQKTIVQICIILGMTGLVFGLVAISSPFMYQNWNSNEPSMVKVRWERGNDCSISSSSSSNKNENLDASKLLLSGGDLKKRYKVKGFVGIFTGFGSAGRRRALRQTWLPSTLDGLQRLEKETGLAFRFLLGKTDDEQKMSELKEEVSQFNDFILLNLTEDYSKLAYKTLVFLKVAYALFDSEFYVKADDDIYLRPDRLSLLLAKERTNPRTYIGCMKNGRVFKSKQVKWYEPLAYLFGSQYFLHAYGPIYALSAKVVQTMAALSIDDFRMFGNEDVMIGAWMLAMNVNHEDNNDLCSTKCTSTSIAVWDKPECSGLCEPEKSLLELHKFEACSGNHTASG